MRKILRNLSVQKDMITLVKIIGGKEFVDFAFLKGTTLITIQSRDLVSLWFDLASGWISGQETWIDEKIGRNHIAYHCLLTGGWDHRPFESEGENLTDLMRLKIPQVPAQDYPTTLNGSLGVYSYDLGQIRIDSLRKANRALSFHVYVPRIEFPRNFFDLLLNIDALFEHWKVPHLTPVGLHITALEFSEVTMPFLLPIMGRKAFFSAELSEIINTDLDNLSFILSEKYTRKKHQAVWRLVKKRLGPEEVYGDAT